MPHLRPALICLTATALFAQSAEAQDAQSAPKVTIAAAHMQDVTEASTFIGRVEAVDSVDLVARVTGYLRAIEIANGADVTTGEVLFHIEPEQYEATVNAQQAELARAEANQSLAQIELDRKRQLVDRNAAPQSELDMAIANEKEAQAQIEAARASLRRAELDLSYTEIVAPFDGRVGRIDGSVGDLVGPGTGALATLVRVEPVFVAFSVSERQIADIMQQVAAEGGDPSALPADLPVFVDLPNGARLDETGHLSFADNRIDTATGTMAVRAEFANTGDLLIPGAFVNVVISPPEPTPRLTIPQAAVQRDQRGDFVLVVGKEQTVEQRYITTGANVGIDVVVESGLVAGESVIVEGLQRVRPGVPVQAVLAGTAD